MDLTKRSIHLKFLGCADLVADLSDVPRYAYGAVLVHKRTIISSGFNKTKTHPAQAKANQHREDGKRDRSFVHAEVAALVRMRNVPKGSVLYISRKGGKLARPCNGCMSVIREKGIRQIVYTTTDGYAVENLI